MAIHGIFGGVINETYANRFVSDESSILDLTCLVRWVFPLAALPSHTTKNKFPAFIKSNFIHVILYISASDTYRAKSILNIMIYSVESLN